jgi:phosphopantothenoylcysteine decarboxylase/phosphopantothenate--cysteine ligase
MHVIVGITGGIAAYKAVGIIRLLTEAGHTVKVIPTQNALRFVGATTLEALSHNVVDADLYTDVESVKHVKLGQEADLVIVAPASAAFLARFSAGIADDLLGNTLLVTKAPILVAPAMHTEMWQNPATTANVANLKSRGVSVLEPASGRLTGSDAGVGRMPEPDEIVTAALSLISPHDLAGKKIVITAGGTHEPIDPVRFIGNRSSGAQGLALAKAAKARGAQVTLIAANVSLPMPDVAEYIAVETSEELETAVMRNLNYCDVLIMAAAVADYRVEEVSNQKIKRSQAGTEISLKLVANNDILAGACNKRDADSLNTLIIGFAAETAGSHHQLEQLAVQKLNSKGCDLLVANDVSDGAIFGSNETSVLILEKTGGATAHSGSKLAVADRILDVIIKHL